VEEAGSVPVVAGLSATFTEQAIEEAKRAEGAGAAGLLVFPIPAYQGTPLDPAIPVAYHEAIARGCGLPMIAFQLQPALGGVIFSEETLRRIAAIDSVVALKEASFDARLYLLTRRLIERLARPIDLLTGDDNFTYESFVMGAEGALIGFGTLATDLQVRMHELTRAGRWDEARAIWERILPLEEAVYGQPVRDYRARTKVALRHLGVIESTVMRPPLTEVSAAESETLRAALDAAGLLTASLACWPTCRRQPPAPCGSSRARHRQRRAHEHRVRPPAHHADRHEILRRVERKAAVERAIDGGRRSHHQERVPVGRRTRHRFHRDVAARAGAVLQHEWLAEGR
jgi:4-hydroxy-tetrahydrodipicolinate synthase